MKKKTTKTVSLEQGFSQLESIVSEFESGALNLEQAIARFKQGVKLVQQLKQRLQVLENEIKKI
ncbi:exodeoxyribonuclease VII small subunit [Candidatus Roizmanbacteria bacterium RIFOXYB2_FULL_41_10]|uniref:Exodeoxyribonuclease VII small subunit n=1 Tax=Candidatus Roizmanbacteria bacterium RIFOXYA1_FULL_41_12 TaxID=1802082 RepID=A0A1F7KGE9_9BACT|nr:MAG: exodeoxyribonuclease VII small subunit [Candidatus Roizmanbacteria bacterium RIFOXYA2_FULL_41_8]OGK66492.1 MAG: exodeoxyribonuclease VII small subunit [Candidatus Roizmanbacteria bacterium RIFOXYB1_FULL_41_27]OGK66940.1 MAG: exodeoxyribonuclease VII small subunit [Candidatus Roizmanbacteria bacterium RIFOXYA1_FULL_41_12]OGK72275.1 MAG: exodeoxyribonuclease VII small subunit [Candidatus Roizmanbacteria bacterium RIFOXYB2_FULL_41_10]OGK72301.1 MAG: exodeoxyribonuclease VII small subunit [